MGITSSTNAVGIFAEICALIFFGGVSATLLVPVMMGHTSKTALWECQSRSGPVFAKPDAVEHEAPTLTVALLAFYNTAKFGRKAPALRSGGISPWPVRAKEFAPWGRKLVYST